MCCPRLTRSAFLVGQGREVAVAAVEMFPGACAANKLGGRFRLEDRVGGAYGASLWKATDELLRRLVAIYVLPDGLPPVAALGHMRCEDYRSRHRGGA